MSCECSGNELWGCGDPECPADKEPEEREDLNDSDEFEVEP